MNLLAYKQAMQILRDAEKKAAPGDLPGIKYFMARCYSGMGQPDKAVESYLQVITDSPSSEFALYSNRRILRIGTKSGNKKIIEISKNVNTKLKDPVFDRMVNEQDKLVESEDLPGTIEIEIPVKIEADIKKYTEAADKKPAATRELVITTSDGNTFRGKQLNETKTEIILETSIGRITVKKDKITSIKKR